MENPLVDKKYLLEKFPGKGGWTYAQIPEVVKDKSAPFGWVRVKGRIDGYEIKSYHLMPMGNGKLFLPVKSEIRKKIKKKEGDYVHIILFIDNQPVEIPEELSSCLQVESGIFEAFKRCSKGEQKRYVEWIYSAKTDKTKEIRIVQLMDILSKNNTGKQIQKEKPK
jgi:hypothetical protein